MRGHAPGQPVARGVQGSASSRSSSIPSPRTEGDLKIVGSWYSAIASPAVQHHLDGGEFETLMKTNRKANRYLRGLTGYQRGLVANRAGIWNR
jgi:hypothetical protein